MREDPSAALGMTMLLEVWNETGFLYVFLIGLHVFHNVPDLAMEYFTEDFDGVGADALISFEPCDLSGADMVLLDQSVLGDSLLLHNLPQIVVGNHNNQASLSA